MERDTDLQAGKPGGETKIFLGKRKDLAEIPDFS
jgi:hypothetical protein